MCVAFAYTHSDGTSNGNADSDGNGISITNAYGDVNAQAHSDSETGSHTTAASDTGASTVMLADRRGLKLIALQRSRDRKVPAARFLESVRPT